MYMLDTDTIIMAIRYPERPVFNIIEQHLGKDICISVVTLAELEYGIKKSKLPDETREGVYQFLAGIPVLDFDTNAAMHYGNICDELEINGQHIRDRDIMIAAHARSLDYTFVTNNIKKFILIEGLRCEDWCK